MKTLIIAAIAALTAAGSVLAGQCEGMTQAGKRCKRESAEGSKYCIGHADQGKVQEKEKKAASEKTKSSAKKATEAKEAPKKEKDDGTCWAVTDAGTRCKHKKDGESDYCKQHAPDVKPAKPQSQCRAMTWGGTRCSNKPEEGFLYCKQHRK